MAVNSSATTLTVASTTSFAPTGVLSIDSEILFYTGKTSTTFTGCVRGQNGTAAAAHTAGVNVETLIVAAYHSILSSAAVALETKLGSGSSTPTNGALLQGTGSGTSAWNSDVYVASTLGIGTSPIASSVGLNLAKALNSSALAPGTNYYYGERNFVTVNLPSNSVAGWRAYVGYDRNTLQGSYNAESLLGRRIDVMHGGTGTVAIQTGLQVALYADLTSGTATTTNGRVVEISAVKQNAGNWSVGDLKMITVNAPQSATGGLSGTTLTGFYMGDYGSPPGTWTNKYALYISGGTSYHAGSFGIGTTAANSPLHVSGAVSTATASKTSAYTLTASDSVLLGNATSAAFNVTLPTAVGIIGRQYTLVKTDSSGNAVTVQTTSSQTINGSSTFALSTQWSRLTVVSDGANWVIVSL